MSYGIFASYYDLLTDNVGYADYAKRIDELVMKHRKKRGQLVDLACGTASLDFELEKLGYDVLGIDLSCDMLSQAAQRKYENGSKLSLVQQDITAFSLPDKADVFVCTLDALNHLPSLEDVKKTFKRVAKYLSKDGLFIFDMNTIYKHEQVLSDNAFVFDTDDAFVAWQNDFDKTDNSVTISLDFFVPNEEGAYERYSEEFKEIAYSEQTVAEVLKASGLELIETFDDVSNDPPSKKTQRVLYVCRKNKFSIKGLLWEE